MSSTRAAIRYAKAILEMAHSKSVANEVSQDMALIATTIKDNAELKTFIENPTLRVEAKQNALLEVFASVNAVTKSLFRLLFENKRFEILEAIALEYIKLFDIANNVEVVKVTTAVTMTPDLEVKVLAKIKEFSSKKIIMEKTIDPAIIGGFILRIGDKEYNASVANSLYVLKRELSN
jgi:F-type H+-transporting ATPase subunit delta